MNSASDDMTFLRQLIADLEASSPVDPRRVFVVGFSAGGLLAYRAGVELSEQTSGIGVVAGSFCWNVREERPTSVPEPKRSLRVLVLHGKQDKNVSYDGFDNGRALCWASRRSVEFWVERNRCSKTPAVQSIAEGKVIRETYGDGRDGTEVVFYTIVEGGHSWFNAARDGISATDILVDFFGLGGKLPTTKPTSSSLSRELGDKV